MPTETSLMRRIHALRQMSVAELHREWESSFPELPKSQNKDFLYRRLAWRIQELAHGGLSNTARDSIDRLAPESISLAQTPCAPDATEAPQTRPQPKRDPRLPAPGTVLVRDYNGTELRLSVHDDHFEMDGQTFHSLSEAARHATGSRWNGFLFWGLTKRGCR